MISGYRCNRESRLLAITAVLRQFDDDRILSSAANSECSLSSRAVGKQPTLDDPRDLSPEIGRLILTSGFNFARSNSRRVYCRN